MTSNTEASFNEKLRELLKIDDGVYNLYTTYEDPISGKIDEATREEIIRESAKVGNDLARKLLAESPDKSVEDWIEANEIEIVIEEKKGRTKYVYFGSYDTHGPITLYEGNLSKSEELLEEEAIDWLTVDDVSEIILAHELFHYYEDQYPDFYTNTKEVELWTLGPYTHTSNVICASEIAAMAFAKTLLDLAFNIEAINYVLYSSIDRDAGEAFYKKIVDLAD